MAVQKRWRHFGRRLIPEALRKAIRIERNYPAPFTTRLKAWRLGFSTASYVVLDLERNDPRAYLPDMVRFAQSRIEGKFARILEDKVLFSAVAGAHVAVPRVLAIVARGRLVPVVATERVRDIASLLAYAARQDGVIVKPARGNRGRQVSCIEHGSSGPLLNGRSVDANEIAEYVGRLDDFIVTDRVRQAEYAAQIFPDAANTIRVITLRDPDQRRPFIPVAAHRFGVAASAPADNWAKGGLVSKVDLATGRLEAGTRDPRISRLRYPRHPETGAQIEGVEIPGWSKVVQAVLGLAEELSFLTFVGWDVVVTDDGVVILEGNNPPDRAIQMMHPFMQEPRTRRFFEDIVRRSA